MQLRQENFLGFIQSQFSVSLATEYCRDTLFNRENGNIGGFY